jgi:hypothetical protein
MAIDDAKLAPMGDPATLKRNAVTQLMAHIYEESGMGVMETGARQRAQIATATLGLSDNPLGKSLFLFKTFSMAMMLKHWNRAASMGTLGSKLGYGTIMAVYGTVIAATINALVRPLLSGQNPPSVKDPKFWASAIMRGGGLGYFGDFLNDELNAQDKNPWEVLGGPMASEAMSAWSITGKPLVDLYNHRKTTEGADLIKYARDHNPANVWYTSAAWDHMLWNRMQEAANPGYLNRMMDRQRKYDRTYWWNPHDAAPAQGPDFSKVAQ